MLRVHETPTRKLPIDRVGLGLLIIWVGALQVMLDLGKNADWFHDPFIVVLAIITAVGLLAWLIWELTDAHPIVDLSLLSNRNFLFGSLALCLGFAIYFANVVLLPLWLQTQLGYTATWAGLAVAPSGVVAVVLTPLIARIMRVVDVRWIATMSFAALVGSYMMRAGYTTDVSFATIALGSAVQGIGASGFFLSLLTILLDRVPPNQTPSATGLSNFVRIVVGSFATSITTTMWDRREALHQSHLVESATPASASYVDALHRLGGLGLQGPSADAAIQHQLVGQAYLLSTVELYWAFALMTGLMILFVWLTKRAKGGHGAAAAE
jgi:DHA2 family multidrug resistance protein